jgi:putative ABC transport system substrate-binding protein
MDALGSGESMKRREFLIAAAMLVTPMRRGSAQQPAKMKRLAIIEPAAKPSDVSIGGNPGYAIFFEEMERLGYVEGRNLIVERYCLEGRFDRVPEIVDEVVAARPDVIFVIRNDLTLAIMSKTHTIPIVAWTGDPIAAGIVSSLARPGGNVTGVSIDAGAEIGGKLIELLAKAVGKLSNIRMLLTVANQEASLLPKAIRAAAEKMNIPIRPELLQSPINEAEYRRAFDAMQRDHVDGVVIPADSMNYTYRVLLGRLAQQYRLPAICWFSGSVEAGALMSYAAFNLDEEARRLAAQVVEILNGGNPAEMPVFQETHFDLVINLKAAKELGLEIPAELIARADRLIE